MVLPGKFVLRHRASIGLLLLAITAFMGYWALHVEIATRFVDFFPAQHPYVKLYQENRVFGGADRLAVMLQVKKGDIFNAKTLKKIKAIHEFVDRLPGVNHNEVFSLASENVGYTRTVAGGLDSRPFMYPDAPTTPEGIADLKYHVTVYRHQLVGLVSPDNRSAIVAASFNDFGLDYQRLFVEVQQMVAKYQSPNERIYVCGEPIVRGYGYHYKNLITGILIASLATMILILYLALRDYSRWWAPIVTGSFSAIWGLGFVGLMHYTFDPVMLVVPLILTARDMSHGIQWQRRYYDELGRLGDKYAACIETTDAMLPPGFLSIIADIAGIIFISLGGIPVLHHIGLAGSVWLAGSLTMVFIFQPIFVSYLPTPARKEGLAGQMGWVQRVRYGVTDAVARFPVGRGIGPRLVMALALALVVWGIADGLRARVGYDFPGTPLYPPGAKVNQDTAAINKVYPTDEGWIIITAPTYPLESNSFQTKTLRMIQGLRAALLEDPDVVEVDSFATGPLSAMEQMFHYGEPKYFGITSGVQMAANLWALWLSAVPPEEIYHYYKDSHLDTTCVRVYLRDHTTATLERVRARINDFIAQHLNGNPAYNKIQIHYLGALAGLYLAAADVLYKLDFINITFVLAVVFLFCVIAFRSFVAGGLFLFACILANFGAFIYLNARGIGITIDTIPVISLGIGLGIDYGIYTVARIRDEVMGGRSVDDAVVTGIRTTGAAVFSTFMVMIGGIVLWMFSPLLFHSQMSMLLVFLMFTNMVTGVVVMPCFISWTRPAFIAKHEKVGGETVSVGVVAHA